VVTTHHLPLAVGIDVGTSSVKAVALTGTAVSRSVRLPITMPATTSALWTLFKEALTCLLSLEERTQVASLCVSGRAPTLVGIRADQEEGPIVGWQDSSMRAEERFYMDSIAKSLMEEDRDLYDNCRFIVNPHEFLTYKLTGFVRSSTPSALYHPWGGYVTEATRRIRRMRIDMAKVAPPTVVGSLIGAVSREATDGLGLDPSTRVVMGGWDFMADLLGSGLIVPGELLIRAGTSLAVDALWSRPLEAGGFFSVPHLISGLFVVGKIVRLASGHLGKLGIQGQKVTLSSKYDGQEAHRVAEAISSLVNMIGEPSVVACSGMNALDDGFCLMLSQVLERAVERVSNTVAEARGAAIVGSIASGLTPTYEEHARTIRSERETIEFE
jgi:sugar (pentulose or hexulose) kinase